MKKIALYLFLLTSINLYGQLPTITTSMMQTSYGSQLHLSCYKDNNGYNVTISLWQRYLGNVINLSAEFKPSEVDKFKRDLREIQLKYCDWVETAKRNNVRTVQKDIPVTITSTISGSGTRVAPTKDAHIKPIFRVSEYQPMCVIKIYLRFYQQYQECEWLLSSSDIDGLIKEIDNIRMKQRKTEGDRKRTEDLFN